MKDPEYPGKRWHEGVNYFFDSKFSTPEIKSVFKKATELWMNNTCIDIREEKYARDTVRVYKGEGCWSFVGRIGATQSLSLGPGCETVGTAAHEIGHALGFFHTHSRYDRDEYITVDVANIKRDWADQFLLRTIENNYNYDLTYDWDICKNKPSSCKNHGFPNPRDCNKCICPGGYGGPQCDRRPDGCGEELAATDKWQQFKDQLGEASDSPREDFIKCNYWIKAPAGKKVQVKIISFSKGVATDGCIYAGVEIKTHADQRLTGYRQVTVQYIASNNNKQESCF
ncbi:astacin [Teladorsagia circumcincta]|uniref:Metalloendopeptidase n=1 Tax=Teladorsagia circumcincta TaxID=45464 RepID=A0A2G9TWA7_TELCI|nr:astacin [Teladorsagia circumcincta]